MVGWSRPRGWLPGTHWVDMSQIQVEQFTTHRLPAIPARMGKPDEGPASVAGRSWVKAQKVYDDHPTDDGLVKHPVLGRCLEVTNQTLIPPDPKGDELPAELTTVDDGEGTFLAFVDPGILALLDVAREDDDGPSENDTLHDLFPLVSVLDRAWPAYGIDNQFSPYSPDTHPLSGKLIVTMEPFALLL